MLVDIGPRYPHRDRTLSLVVKAEFLLYRTKASFIQEQNELSILFFWWLCFLVNSKMRSLILN